MSYSTKENTAHAKAGVLVALLGPGWEPRVWNNLGWCYAAQCLATPEGPSIHVHPNGDDTYTVFVSDSASSGQPTYYGRCASHKDPREALRLALEDVGTHVKQVRKTRIFLASLVRP